MRKYPFQARRWPIGIHSKSNNEYSLQCGHIHYRFLWIRICWTTEHTSIVMDNSFPYFFPPRIWESRPLMGTAQLSRWHHPRWIQNEVLQDTNGVYLVCKSSVIGKVGEDASSMAKYKILPHQYEFSCMPLELIRVQIHLILIKLYSEYLQFPNPLQNMSGNRQVEARNRRARRGSIKICWIVLALLQWWLVGMLNISLGFGGFGIYIK